MFEVRRVVVESIGPATYKLKELDGTPVQGMFYSQELQKVHVDRLLLDKTWICDHTSERQLTGTWCTPVSRKLWTKSTPYKKFTKSGTSNTHATICLRNMSTHGSRSKKKPVAFLLIALLTNTVNMLQITKLMKAFTPI